ncbi:hypothetical protein DFR70_108189 [Nocardia tenerifensis]|uniref:DUF4352 domain-containing protein n=1 Tax=Nocardia tenerifensis TaxID=228006 RepID=A0A318K0X0_9NOCA|nr:DUF4352 domain-containing protein [Nocardia tenerifensis]PXX61631.1 hypothetical protein DFR70_108189 [Nocardia tenerifensis]
MRRLLPLLLLSLTACGAEPGTTTPPPTTTVATYVRTPQDCAKLTVTPLSVESGIGYIIGTHAEWLPNGQYVRIRVAITNTDSTFHTTRPTDYQLDDAADRPHQTSVDAMEIKRQPNEPTIGAGNRLEMDLWYDIPTDTAPKVLRDTTCATTIPLPA